MRVADFFSTMISVYNKWMFSTAHYKFSYPLFVTSAHMIMQFLLSGLLLSCCGNRIVPRNSNGRRPRPSFHDWLSKVVPCAAATAIDIGLSNLSLKTITLTFYSKSASTRGAYSDLGKLTLIWNLPSQQCASHRIWHSCCSLRSSSGWR